MPEVRAFMFQRLSPLDLLFLHATSLLSFLFSTYFQGFEDLPAILSYPFDYLLAIYRL